MPLGLSEEQWKRFVAMEPAQQQALIEGMSPMDALTFDADF